MDGGLKPRHWAALGLLALGPLLAGLWLLRGLPDPRPLRDPAWVRQRFNLGAWTPLDAVAPVAVRAVLISEDDTFYRHHGVRVDELGAAAWDDLLSLRYKRGASSLTQQVVKNAFLGPQKTLLRKVRELVLARQADAAVGKRRLLEDYLNLAEWGPHRQRGIAYAAQACFGKDPAQLDAREGALLAWLLPDPHRRCLWVQRGELPRRARLHVARVLDRLEAEGALPAGQAAVLAARPFAFERRPAALAPAALTADDDDLGDDEP